ncbi:hypothetical protein SDJN03_14749, partial [Cucurbita argyrosperma subsp. sororia]
MKESHKSMPQIVAWVMSSDHNRRVFCQSRVSGVRESDRVVTELLPESSLSPEFKKTKKEEGCAVIYEYCPFLVISSARRRRRRAFALPLSLRFLYRPPFLGSLFSRFCLSLDAISHEIERLWFVKPFFCSSFARVLSMEAVSLSRHGASLPLHGYGYQELGFSSASSSLPPFSRMLIVANLVRDELWWC